MRYGKILVLLFFAMFFVREAKSSNLQIFRFCKQVDIIANAIIASDNDTVILADFNSVNSINLDNFVINWSYDIPGFLVSKPRVEQNKIILETSQKNEDQKNLLTSQSEITQTILNVNSGIPLEVTKLKKKNIDINSIDYQLDINQFINDRFSIRENPTVIKNNTEDLIFGFKNGSILFINRKSRMPVWKKKVGGEITSIIVLRNGILVGSKDNFLYLLDRKNADIIWKKRVSGRILNLFALEKNLVAISIGDSNEVLLIEANTGSDVGKIMKEFPEKILAIENYAQSDLILLTDSNLTLYSVGKCK